MKRFDVKLLWVDVNGDPVGKPVVVRVHGPSGFEAVQRIKQGELHPQPKDAATFVVLHSAEVIEDTVVVVKLVVTVKAGSYSGDEAIKHAQDFAETATRRLAEGWDSIKAAVVEGAAERREE